MPAPEDLTAERPPLSPDHPGAVPRPAAGTRPGGRRRGRRWPVRGAPAGRQARVTSGSALPEAEADGPALGRRRAGAGDRAYTGGTSCAASTAPRISIGRSSEPCCTRWGTCEGRTTARCAIEDWNDAHRGRSSPPTDSPSPCCWPCWRPCNWRLLAAAGAHAAEDEAAGRQHCDRGQELYKQGRFLEAAREFEAGYQVGAAIALPAEHRPQLPPGPGTAPGQDGLRELPEGRPHHAPPADGRGPDHAPSTTR